MSAPQIQALMPSGELLALSSRYAEACDDMGLYTMVGGKSPNAGKYYEALSKAETIHRQISTAIAAVYAEVASLAVQSDELLTTMRLIQHATAPTHDDGAHHEAAHDLATAAIAKATGSAPCPAL